MTSKFLTVQPLLLPSPEHFSSYARAVALLPELSAEKEHELALLWHDHQDKEAAKELVLGNLWLVVKAVRDHEGYGLNKADLAQEGVVGLMKAIHKFDPHRNLRLSTYAWHWIEAEIREFILKNWRMISWGTSSLAKKLFFGYRKTVAALRSLGEERSLPSSQQIAQAMDVDVEHAELARSYFSGIDVGLWDEHHDDSENVLAQKPSSFAIVFSDDTPEKKTLETDAQQSQNQLISAMHTVLSDLPARQQEIIRQRYLTSPPATLTSLAKTLGISIERVRQVEAQALQNIRGILTAT